MTLLPAVREQIDVAARRQVRANRSRSTAIFLGRPRQLSLAAAAVLAASLTMALGAYDPAHERSGPAAFTPPVTAGVFVPAPTERLQAAVGVRWDLRLTETIP